jgi:hypothetical protein
MEEHLATDEEVAGSIPAAGVYFRYLQTYPSGYGARLLSECPLDAQVRTLPSAFTGRQRAYPLLGQEGKSSPAGNRTRVIRVTGGYTYLYTTEELWCDKEIRAK